MTLQRPRYPMPDFVRDALTQRGLMEAYKARPDYQQNDYIYWISNAKQEETRMERLEQMLQELANGDAYMKMAYNAKKTK